VKTGLGIEMKYSAYELLLKKNLE